MDLDVIAIDIAKKLFQLHWVEPDTGSIERLKLNRAQLLGWFAAQRPVLVVMEACRGPRMGQRAEEARPISAAAATEDGAALRAA